MKTGKSKVETDRNDRNIKISKEKYLKKNLKVLYCKNLQPVKWLIWDDK